MNGDAIKSMQLYSSLDRISRDLAASGYPSGPVPIDVMVRFDQLHYHGTAAVDKAIVSTNIEDSSLVLDIGSGYGGPARWIAEQTGARVDAVELQADLSAIAADLTGRVGLDDKVSLITGDILEVPLVENRYDCVVSFLTLYHIPHRSMLFPRLRNTMQAGTTMHVEDLYLLGTPTATEKHELEHMLHANTLVTSTEYQTELQNAGFTIDTWEDTTQDWAKFTAERLRLFRSHQTEYEKVHGADTFESLEKFYVVIARLLAGGNVGGVIYTARNVEPETSEPLARTDEKGPAKW